MRISDWSSDVCSSDLALVRLADRLGDRAELVGGILVKLVFVVDARDRAVGRNVYDIHLVDVKNSAASVARSEEHTSELQALMRISYAVFCLKKKNKQTRRDYTHLPVEQTIQAIH